MHMPLLDQHIHNALLEGSTSLKQMLLQLWQNDVILNCYCCNVLKMVNTVETIEKLAA